MGLGGQRYAPAAPASIAEGGRGSWVSLSGLCRREYLSSPPGIEPHTIHHVASHYIDYAIPDPVIVVVVVVVVEVVILLLYQ
jgi:hypothetical protein